MIGKAVEKDRKLRCQTASDLRADLQRLKRDSDPVRSGASGALHEARSGSPGKTAWSKSARLGLAIAIVAAIVAIGAYAMFFRSGDDVVDSLAVLPFVNVNADPNTEYLNDGITQTLIELLSEIPKLDRKGP